MSVGHTNFDDSAPSKREATLHALWHDYPRIRERAISEHRFDRQYEVPYLGGISVDGATIYIDCHLPSKIAEVPLELSVSAHEATEYAIVREVCEWDDATRRKWRVGKSTYEFAHHLATCAERLVVEDAGFEWEPYKLAFRKFYKPIEQEKLSNPPPDLALYPYSGRLLQTLRANLVKSKLTKAVSGYSLSGGNARVRCGTCSMFLPRTQRCVLVEGAINAWGVCDYWEKKQ